MRSNFDSNKLIVTLMKLIKIQTQETSKERLFIMTRTHSMQIFGEILFVKPQNDT